MDQVRQAVKDHLDNDSFFRLDYWYKARGVSTLEEYYEKWQNLVLTGDAAPGEHQYNVPAFRLRERRRMISGY
ncbi:MAG TPA: hypothetical protein VHE55_04590 [Fimbriimonadaceae bacterium]|nr:hypothetical protein [Fimbriimonadaceae bacterium]